MTTVHAVPAPQALSPSAVRVLRALLAVAVLVSIVHYTDNTVNYDAYPQPTSAPAPSQAQVAAAWFAFTAFGLAGYVLLRGGRVAAGAVCLALYSGSGLVGLGHYTVAGATSMPWWRQAHIVADIACGVAVFTYAIRLARRPRAVRGSRRQGTGSASSPDGIRAGRR